VLFRSLRGTNILGSQGRIIKGGDYPFDYHVEPRRLLGTVAITL
jgi:hypothetical protein